jgi:predicted metalloendopeptidase
MGSHGQRKRWKICVSMTNDYLGEVIGETYSRKHFDKEKKDLVCGLLINILECILYAMKILYN